MIWLNTLGSAVLYDDAKQPIGGAARHRRTIGLLSVLVVAGEAGLTRDKLVGLFWPDFDQKRARHSLTQALYAGRKATGHDDLFDAGDNVRLNFNLIGSDIREFAHRLKSGDDQAACVLYRGPFLDGFYLQAPEFDMWQALERARIEDLAVGALSRVISGAELAGDLSTAIEHARRLTGIRPTDAAAVINLMRLLADSGDRPSALTQARVYTTVMRERYEMEPDAAVVEYMQELRETPQPTTVGEPVRVLPYSSALPAPVRRTADANAEWLEERGPATAERSGPHRAWRVYSSLAFVFAALMLIIALVSRSDRPSEALQPLKQRMVIAPFRVGAADPELSYLSEGMIELLATRLADDSADRAMDAGAIIRAWRSAEISGRTDVPMHRLVTVAGKLGAERVLVGSIVGVPQHIIISASAVTVASEQITVRATVEGSADTLAALVDNLARKLLLAQAEPEERLADRMTFSLAALRAYVRGTGAYARGDYAVAQFFYDRAFSLDSTFALAALKRAMAAGRMADFEAQRIALDHAWRTQRSLSDKDRAFLFAQLGPRYPAASSVSEVVAAWTRAARLAPERPEVWGGLAGALYERQLASRTADDDESVISALERALQLDPGYVPANLLLAQIRNERTPFTGMPGSEIATISAAPFLSWWRNAMQDSAPVPAIRDSLDRLGPTNLRAIAIASHFIRHRREDGERAVQILLAKAAGADEAMSLLTAQHSIALNRGDKARALDATRRMQRMRPAGRAHLRLRVLDALYDGGDSLAAVAAARNLELLTDGPGAAADVCVSAQWHIANGELEAARSALKVLRAESAEVPLIAGVQPATCAPFIEAAVSVAARDPQAPTLVQALDSLAFTNAGAGDFAAYANIAVADMHRKLDAPEEALASIRRRPYGTVVWPRYLATSLRIESELCASPMLVQQCSADSF